MITIDTASGAGSRNPNRRRDVRRAAAASGIALALLLAGAATPALGASEPRSVHVMGDMYPISGRPGVYRVTGGLSWHLYPG